MRSDPFHPFDWLKNKLKPIVEENVYLWSIGMALFQRVPALLPHDLDYHALRHFLRAGARGGLFLDVGANVGLSARSFRKLEPAAPILSLEPNPLCERPLARIKRTDPAFDYRMVAIGSEPGTKSLFVPFVGRIALHTMASTSREELERSARETLSARYRPRLQIRSYEVTVVRIDDLSVVPAIVKIDSEGSEDSIFEGAQRTVEEHRPYLMIENNARTIGTCRDRLAAHGYECRRYASSSDSFQPVGLPTDASSPRNVFFIPMERLAEINGSG